MNRLPYSARATHHISRLYTVVLHQGPMTKTPHDVVPRGTWGNKKHGYRELVQQRPSWV